MICVDETHHNFHRIDGRLEPFAELARADGFRVEAIEAGFHVPLPADCRLLVIANALPSDRDWEDYPYPTPPAFDAAEVARLTEWVRDGGRLLLIADHMPFPGAAAELGAAFGCRFLDGFAVAGFTTEAQARANFLLPTLFTPGDGTLPSSPATLGRPGSPPVTQVATFVGQAFQCGADAEPLLVLPAGYLSLMPQKAWQFTMETPRVDVGHWLQGALVEIGQGHAAIFGEAAMFTAQIADDGRRMGMNAVGGEQNGTYVLNLLEWLTRP
ncbi:MAG: DUF4350 domain-containing protein [Steroidobacteraceae bacterium]